MYVLWEKNAAFSATQKSMREQLRIILSYFIYELVKEDDKMMIVYSSLAKYYNWEEAHNYFDNYKIMKRLIDNNIKKGT